MKKFLVSLFVLIMLLGSSAFADYSQDMNKGKEAYMAGNYNEALKYYKEAFSENPTTQLGSFIVKLEQIVKKSNVQKQAAAIQPEEKPKTSIYPASIAMVIVDLALVGISAYEYLDYNNTLDSYNNLYAQINYTTQQNYQTLLGDMDNAQSKQNTMVLFSSLAGAAVIYTLADVFFIHAAFPVNISAGYDPNKGQVKLALKKEF